MLTGRKKLERYQDDLKAYMVARGWPVERDVDSLRHDKTATKAVYGAMKDKERALAEQEQKLVADRAAAHSEIASEIEATVDELAGRWEALNAERAAVESEREQLQKDREQVRKQLDQAKALVAVAEKQGEPIPLAQTRTIFKISTGMFADRLIAKGIRPDIVENAKEWADKASRSSAFEETMGQAQVEYDRRMNRSQQLRQMVNESTEQLNGSTHDFDDGMEL